VRGSDKSKRNQTFSPLRRGTIGQPEHPPLHAKHLLPTVVKRRAAGVLLAGSVEGWYDTRSTKSSHYQCGRRLHSWCGSPSQHTRAQQRPALIEQDAEQLSATHPVQLSAVTRHSDTQERGARRCECPNVPDFPAARLWRRHAPQPCTGPLNVHRSTVSLPLAVVGGRPTAPWHGRPSVTLASSLVAPP
jgi:hypothetical protein